MPVRRRKLNVTRKKLQKAPRQQTVITEAQWLNLLQKNKYKLIVAQFTQAQEPLQRNMRYYWQGLIEQKQFSDIVFVDISYENFKKFGEMYDLKTPSYIFIFKQEVLETLTSPQQTVLQDQVKLYQKMVKDTTKVRRRTKVVVFGVLGLMVGGIMWNVINRVRYHNELERIRKNYKSPYEEVVNLQSKFNQEVPDYVMQSYDKYDYNLTVNEEQKNQILQEMEEDIERADQILYDYSEAGTDYVAYRLLENQYYKDNPETEVPFSSYLKEFAKQKYEVYKEEIQRIAKEQQLQLESEQQQQQQQKAQLPYNQQHDQELQQVQQKQQEKSDNTSNKNSYNTINLNNVDQEQHPQKQQSNLQYQEQGGHKG